MGQELDEKKAQIRAWLLMLLSELELTKEVEGKLTTFRHTTTLIITMKS